MQRIGIDIQANGSRHAQHQCRQRQHARSRANVEDAVGNRDGQGLFESLDAQCRSWMMSGSKGRGIGQSERVGWGGDFRRRDQDTPNRTARGLSSQTDPLSRATAGDTSTLAHAQGVSHRIRRHTIRNDRRKPVVHRLDIERAQLHELVQRVLRWVKDINAVRHSLVS